MQHILGLLGFAVLMSTGCTGGAAACCDCLVENDCWDSEICPDDPYGSCEYVRGDGDLPSYADDDDEVCYATGVECEETQCASECEGLDD